MEKITKTRSEILNEIFGQYGTAAPVKIDPAPKKETTVTSVTGAIHDRIEKAVDFLQSVPSIQKLRKNDCRPHRIINKKYGNIFVKIGYGGNNMMISRAFPERNFQTIGEAVDFLWYFDQLLLKGFFELEISALVDTFKEAAEHARAQREKNKEKQKNDGVSKKTTTTSKNEPESPNTTANPDVRAAQVTNALKEIIEAENDANFKKVA